MKKALSILIAICIILSTVFIPAFATEGYLDAYSEISTYADYYEKSDNITIGATYMSFAANSWISYKVDFGTSGARVFYMNYTIPDSYAGRTIKMYLDSMNGEPAFQFNTTSTGSWSNYVIDEFVLDAPIKGEHIVYLTAARSGTCDNKAFGFKNSYTEISGPEITLKDENDEVTEDIADAKTVTADASFLSYADTSANAYLIMETFDKDFLRVADMQIDSVLEVNSKETSYMLDVSQDLTDFTDVNVFSVLLDENFKPLSNASVINAPEITSSSRSAEKDMEYYIDNTKVSLYGKLNDEGGKILIGVRKNDVSISDYESYEVIYEVAISDGVYDFAFNMDEETPTGTYTAVYVTESGSEGSIDFHYSRPGDIVDAFEEINSSNAPAKEDETVENSIDEVLNKWKNTLGINLDYINDSPNRDWIYTRLYEKLPFKDLNDINNAIEQIIFLDKINTDDSYIENIEIYKKAIGLNEDEFYKKYFIQDETVLSEAEMSIFEEKLDGLIEDEKPLLDTETFNEFFVEALAVTMISNQVAWGSVDEILTEFEDIFDTEYMDKYMKLSNSKKKSVAQKFLNKDFATADEVVDLLESSYKNMEKEEKSDSNKGSGGSRGGGGSSKGFTAEIPKVERPEEPVITAPVQQEEKISFDDLKGFDWANDAIIYLAENKIINGKDQNSFAPAENISREEFVKILVLALGETNLEAECTFSDINVSDWSYPYVATACKNGWVNGYEDGNFGIGESITREQMATMFYRAILDTDGATEVVNSTVSFVDYEQISDYAIDAVINLAKAEIMNGVGMGMFEPNRTASRAEAAALMYKYLKRR